MRNLLNKRLMMISLMIGASVVMYAQFSSEVYKDYIKNYANLAMQEMKRTGVPASVKLAQALLETNAGKSDLAIIANNHFNLICENTWTGIAYHKMNGEINEEGKPILTCYKVFDTAEESYVAHSQYIMNLKNAGKIDFLLDLPILNYKDWANGLAHIFCFYDIEYGNRLIFLIEQFELYEYDKMMVSEKNYYFTSRAYLTNGK